MPAAQRQFDFSRGAQLMRLRQLSIPDGISKDGSRVAGGTSVAVLRAIDDRCGKNGEQWWDMPTLAAQVGKSERTVRKAVQVLESMHLIHKLDTRRGGARRLVISIDWQTVFGDDPYQDPTVLAEWGVLRGADEPEESSQRSAVSDQPEGFTTEARRHGEWKSGPQDLIATMSPTSMTKTSARNAEAQGSMRTAATNRSMEQLSSAVLAGAAVCPTDSPSVPPCLRGESTTQYDTEIDQFNSEVSSFNSEVSSFNSEVTSEFNSEVASGLIRKSLPNSLLYLSPINPPTHSAGEGVGEFLLKEEPPSCKGSVPQLSSLNPHPSPMPTRTIDSREDELIHRLLAYGVGGARKALREALRIGYTVEAIDNQWGSGEDNSRGVDVLANPKGGDPMSGIRNMDVLRLVTKDLNRNERLVIILYYFEGVTMKEIGQTLGLCESRVSQIHKRLLVRLRSQLAHTETQEVGA